MRAFLIALLLSLFTSNIYAASGIEKLCDQMDKVASLIAPITYNPFQTIMTTPAGPVPGIILAMVQPDSVFLDLCRMYQNVKLAKGLDKVKMIGDYTNVLTNNKFNAHISFMKDSFDITESLNQVNKMNTPALDKFKAAAPRINSYLGSVNDYYKYYTGEKLESITSRNEREQDMNDLARSSRELAVYGAMLECDTANNRANSSGQNLYSRDVSAYQEEVTMYRSDLDFLFDKLKMMGVKFNSGKSGYDKYLRDLYDLYNMGVEYEGNIANYKETSEYMNPKGNVGKQDVARNYQVISVKNNPQMFDEFQNKYKSGWRDYILSNYADETKGLFDNRSGRIQEEFYDYTFECRESAVYEKVKAKNPDYFKREDDPRKNRAILAEASTCKTQASRDVSKIKNLFVEYTDDLKKALPKYKLAQSKIWTIDSYYNGSFRSITKGVVGTDPNGPIREEVTCSKSINLTEQANLKLKLKQQNVNLRQSALQELNKETIEDEKDRVQVQARKDEEERKMMIQQENDRRNSMDYAKYIDYPQSGGGIGN